MGLPRHVWLSKDTVSSLVADKYIMLTEFSDGTFRLSSGSRDDVLQMQRFVKEGDYDVVGVQVWKKID